MALTTIENQQMEELEPIPEYGSLMTVVDFLQYVEAGIFVDYDGYGLWATETHILSRENVYPSHVKGCKAFVLPEKATHVLWFNR